MKKCFKCLELKSLSEFYKHSKMADGHLNKCKDCTKNDVHVHRDKNIDRIRKYDRNRPNKKERCDKANDYQKTEIGKAVKIKSQINFRARYPKKVFANNLISRYLREGRIFRPLNCEICSIECKPHAHHCDYSKPLDVMWLCQPCHVEWHRENRAING